MLRSRRLAVGLAVVVTSLAALAAPIGAQQVDPPPPDADDIVAVDGAGIEAEAGGTVEKQTSRTAAATSPGLIGRTDGTPVRVAIKLDYDSIATYTGGRDGLAATSPSETGRDLTAATVTASPYARQVARDEAAIVGDIRAAVPQAVIGDSLRVVYGGVTATVPANQVDALVRVPGVVAVQEDVIQQPLTDSSPALIGADQVWAQQGGQATAGNGVIFASLDSGLWPEHPQLTPNGSTGTPPARPGGGSRPCDFGDNPLTPAADPFVCNSKLIGGDGFLDTYNAVQPVEQFGFTARDSNGHGTHTATTVAGNRVEDAPTRGISRGPISGVAPGAWVLGYKVCGITGCYPTDSAAAVGQAILDGADVINFSISGGSNPATDIVELAFLDAYAAGIFVAASAGNSGPTADTADHLSPWVTTVAASGPNRTFASTLTLTPVGGTAQTFDGVSITAGVTNATPVVLGSAAPYNNAQCTTPAPPGLFVGMIVVCQRSPGRITKGFNVLQGGAAGMILYNPTPSNYSADNHWLPTVHVDGSEVATFVGANPGVTATFTQGAATPQTPDELAIFSSRGPGLLAVKPDVSAPGEQILAGTTPVYDDPSSGPPGQYYTGNSGTSMAAPHIAGSAALVMAAHPGWTPGQVRSALTGSASPTVTVNGAPATPFEGGSGRVQVDAAVAPGLLLDETAARFTDIGLDDTNAVHLNIASIAAPAMPGAQLTTRTVTNPGPAATYTVGTTADAGASITVTPSSFTLGTGESQELAVRIESSSAVGTSGFGGITITAPGRPATRLPVSFTVAPSEVTVTGLGCTPDPVTVPQSSTCSFEVGNEGLTDGLVDLRATGDAEVTVTGANLGATTAGGVASVDDVVLDGGVPGVPSVAAGGNGFGYIDLSTFGGTITTAVGDEEYRIYNLPAFTFGGRSYSRLAMVTNGYVIPLGPTDTVPNTDINCCNITPIGDAARPNNVLAPFWTDMTGEGNSNPNPAGFRINVLTGGGGTWIVAQFELNDYATDTTRRFQVWLGTGATEDITFNYSLPTVATAPVGQDVVVGAENFQGAGVGLPLNTAPTADLRVTTGAETPAGVVQWDVTVQGTAAGTGDVRVEATSDSHPGTVSAVEQVQVQAEPAPVVTDDPDDITVDAFETALFTAAATGGTIDRWERLALGGASWVTVPGAMSTTLSFTARGTDSGAQYRAVFVNGSGAETTSAAATLLVEKLDSTTDVSVSPAAPVRGQDVTFTADVGPSTATGTVHFALDGTPVGGPVAVVGGQAVSAPVPDIAAGSHTVLATYSGDDDHLGSDDDDTFSVTRNASTTIVVDVDPDVIVVGDDVLVDVDVSPAPQGGTVSFAVDGAPAGVPITVDPVTGEGTATFSGIGVGDHAVVAEFSGDDDLDGSTSASFAFTVDKRESTTTLSIDPANPVRGNDVVVTAAVGPGTATGTVQFAVDGTNQGAPVAVTAGEASITLSDLSADDHTVTATYSGDVEHLGSDSGLAFMVLRNGSTTTIIEITAGVIGEATPVEATIRVVPAPSGGTVQVTVDGTPYGDPLVLDGAGEATVILTGLTPGTRTIGAAFSGDDDLDPSDDEVDITVYPAAEAFVRRLYQVQLGRNGDESGIAYWTARIEGGLDETMLIDHFARSTEGRRRIVARAYELALDRTSSAADRDYWVQRLAQGLTPEDLLATFLASHEAIVNAGGDAEGWAEKLFDVHLDREPSPPEVTYWAGRAEATENQGQVRQLAKAFGRVPEATSVTIHRSLRLVCGLDAFPSDEARTEVTDAWIASGRNPLVLDGTVLASVCFSSSAPPV